MSGLELSQEKEKGNENFHSDRSDHEMTSSLLHNLVQKPSLLKLATHMRPDIPEQQEIAAAQHGAQRYRKLPISLEGPWQRSSTSWSFQNECSSAILGPANSRNIQQGEPI